MFLFGSLLFFFDKIFFKEKQKKMQATPGVITPDILPRAEDRPMEPTLRQLIVSGK